MATRTGPYLDAIERLPEGATLVVPRVSWEEYEHLLQDLADRPGVRISYDDGRLEVVSPSTEHEGHKDLIFRIAEACADELDLPFESRGSATWKRRAIRKGVEPDTCFYVTNAHRIIGRGEIDLDVDPPPDVVVEIDASNQSLTKLPIYAVLGVPEIWRYDGARVQMYELAGDGYVERADSRFFSGLTALLLLEVLDLSKIVGQTEALKTLRARITISATSRSDTR